ncbi:MAG: thiamine pyrophosphate-dependent enzyme, partial [Ectothiorhodospiraceae bacterium]
NVEEFAPLAEHIAHIDIDAAEVGKVKAVDWAHVGEAGRSMRQLLEHGRALGFERDFTPWLRHVQKLKRNHPLNYDRESELIQPHYVVEALNKITGGDAIIATGVGQHQMWAAQYCDFREPRLWLTSGSMGTMGYGLPAAVGAQFACPDKTVIDLDGDGSIRMNLGELETVTNYNLPVKVLLLNNLGDGMVRQWQRLYFNENFSGSDKALHRKDFIKAAEADGFPFARRIMHNSEVEDTLREFIAFDGPAFLEVMVDGNASVYPMVGPGMGYSQMVTGEWIPSREVAPVQRDPQDPDSTPELF